MKRFFILLYLLFTLTAVHAQKSILFGSIKDSISNLPISFATIALLDIHGHVVDGAVADSIGGFRFLDLKKGQYAILVKFIGYRQKKLVVDLDGT
ncbi:MAG: carboxypeptidase-like regulatory domain-containing protein, partial [Sphingobacterium sp.]